MSKKPRIPRAVALADKIQEEIESRGMKPGDSFMTTAETARMHRVNTATANHALQILAHRGLIERRQRVGTIISRRDKAVGPPQIKRIRILISAASEPRRPGLSVLPMRTDVSER